MYRNLETGKYELTDEEKKIALGPLLIGGAWAMSGLICWLFLYTRDGNYVWFMVGAISMYCSISPLEAGITFWRSMNDE